MREEKLNNQLNAIDRTHLIATFDIDGKFLTANRNLTKLLGYKSDELKKMNHSEVVPPYAQQSKEYRNLWPSLRSGKNVQGDFAHSTKLGLSIWLQSSYTPLKDSSGEYNKILKIVN